MPDDRIQRDSILITDVSSGIGHALAEAYLERGCRLCLVGGLNRRRRTA